jgi:hypothetical protein
VRLARRDVRDHIKHSKTDCRRSYRFYRPCGGWNRQHGSFARFSKARDFRVFQHNPPEKAVVHPESLYFYGQTIKDKRPRGHYTAWPLRDCPPRPSRDSVGA